MNSNETTSYILKKKKHGKMFYLHVNNADSPKPYLTWTTRIIDAALFGKDIDILKYFHDFFGISASQFKQLNIDIQFLTTAEIQDICDKYI